jgi:hypothetical protein
MDKLKARLEEARAAVDPNSKELNKFLELLEVADSINAERDALRAALKEYTEGDECNVDGAPDADNSRHGETCRYCKAMNLLGWPGFER